MNQNMETAKKIEKPEMELIRFRNADIVVASPGLEIEEEEEN